MPAQPETGTIKWFDRKKGFGFVTPSTGGEDIFVHRRNIISEGGSPVLDEGDVIGYEIGEHGGRPTAVNVSLPEGKAVPERRRRGRNANKAADDESEELAKDGEEQAKKELTEASAPAAGEAPKPREGGGRDGKTRRNNSGTRTRRVDKGAKAATERDGEASSRRREQKGEAKRAAGDTNGGE